VTHIGSSLEAVCCGYQQPRYAHQAAMDRSC